MKRRNTKSIQPKLNTTRLLGIPSKEGQELHRNQLYYGDNLENFRKYIKDETIDLCYIDPPFNSKRNYNQIYKNVGKKTSASSSFR